MASGAELHRFPTDGIVSSVRFSPDGRIAAATCWDQKMRFWEAATGKEVHVFRYDSPILDIAFSPDGGRFFLGDVAGTPLLCDAQTGKVLLPFVGHMDWVHNVAISPDGKQALSAGHDGVLKLWEVETGECVRTYKGHVGMVHEVRFLPDGKRMVSCGEDGSIRVWEAASGREIVRGQAGVVAVRGLAVSADGRFAVTAGFDGACGGGNYLRPEARPRYRGIGCSCRSIHRSSSLYDCWFSPSGLLRQRMSPFPSISTRRGKLSTRNWLRTGHGPARIGAHQDGVIDVILTAGLSHVHGLAGRRRFILIRDPYHLQTIAAVGVLQVGQVGDRRPAGAAIALPEVEQHQLPRRIAPELPRGPSSVGSEKLSRWLPTRTQNGGAERGGGLSWRA